MRPRRPSRSIGPISYVLLLGVAFVAYCLRVVEMLQDGCSSTPARRPDPAAARPVLGRGRRLAHLLARCVRALGGSRALLAVEAQRNESEECPQRLRAMGIVDSRASRTHGAAPTRSGVAVEPKKARRPRVGTNARGPSRHWTSWCSGSAIAISPRVRAFEWITWSGRPHHRCRSAVSLCVGWGLRPARALRWTR